MPGSERRRELRRRRSRRAKVKLLRQRAAKATKSDKEVIANKLRGLTPGADVLIEQMELNDA